MISLSNFFRSCCISIMSILFLVPKFCSIFLEILPEIKKSVPDFDQYMGLCQVHKPKRGMCASFAIARPVLEESFTLRVSKICCNCLINPDICQELPRSCFWQTNTENILIINPFYTMFHFYTP